MITKINAWIGRMNRKHRRIMQAIAHENRAMVREDRWRRIGGMVKVALKGMEVETSHFGVRIKAGSFDDLHAARTALKGAIPDYVDEIKDVRPRYSTIYTVAEVKERDEKIKIMYGYNGDDVFYDGAIINLIIPYSQVPESIFKGGKCGFEDNDESFHSVRFVCKNE